MTPFQLSRDRRLIDLVKRFEGLSLEAYLDPAGVWTVGYGHTGAAARPGAVIGPEAAERLLADDLWEHARAVYRLVKVPVSAHQLIALTSFCFNLGASRLASSTLLGHLNNLRYEDAAREFERWRFAAGRPLFGLARRRAAEEALFVLDGVELPHVAELGRGQEA